MPYIKSYLDTALRVIHINRESGLPTSATKAINDLMEQSETSGSIRREFIKRHLEVELSQNEDLLKVLTHEFHHYLQGLFYPFLYYLSWLEFDNLFYLGNQLKFSDIGSMPIEKIHMNQDFFRNFDFLYQAIEFYWERDHLRLRIPVDGTKGKNIFTLNDLLEDATTIFEYRIVTDEPSAAGFNLWINNPINNCYKKVYRFLQAECGSDIAFHGLPILVQLAFSCTEPMTAFCTGVSYINLFGLDYQNKSAYELYTELETFIQSKIGQVDLDPEIHHFIVDIPVGMVGFQNMKKVQVIADGSKTKLNFPLNLHFKKLSAHVISDPTFRCKILDTSKDTFKILLDEFYPFAIHYYYRNFDGRNGSIIMGKDYRNSQSPQGIAYPFYIKELIKLKETHLALFSRSHQFIDHNCHHQACDYYELGLCKLWNSIPYDYKECGFPHYFSHLFRRKIDLVSKRLLIISEEQAELSYHEYKQRSFKTRTFQYTKIENGYLLTIDAEDIADSRTKNMFPDFIKFLKNEFNETDESLFSLITLDFYGYNEDNRPLYDIPEVFAFMQESKQLLPELFYYINFNAEINHRHILVPMFVKHKTINSNGEFQVHLDPNAFEKFAIQEGQIWQQFIIANKLSLTNAIFDSLTKIFIP